MPPDVANTTNGTKPASNRRRGGVTPPYAKRDAARPFPMFSNSNLKTPKLCTMNYALCTSDGSGASRGRPLRAVCRGISIKYITFCGSQKGVYMTYFRPGGRPAAMGYRNTPNTLLFQSSPTEKTRGRESSLHASCYLVTLVDGCGASRGRPLRRNCVGRHDPMPPDVPSTAALRRGESPRPTQNETLTAHFRCFQMAI